MADSLIIRHFVLKISLDLTKSSEVRLEKQVINLIVMQKLYVGELPKLDYHARMKTLKKQFNFF